MAPYEALYGRMCKSFLYWDKVVERQILGLEIIKKTTEKIEIIRARMKVAQSRQNSYANNRCRQLEFKIGDKAFLRIAKMKCVMRFRERGKFDPRHIRPFEILNQIGLVLLKRPYQRHSQECTMCFMYLFWESTISIPILSILLIMSHFRFRKTLPMPKNQCGFWSRKNKYYRYELFV